MSSNVEDSDDKRGSEISIVRPRTRTASQPVYNVKELLGPITQCIGKAHPRRKKKQPLLVALSKSSTVVPKPMINGNESNPKLQVDTGVKKPDRPRWWNQTYLLYLVLRKATRPLGRKDLISEALNLDEVISKERGLPKLFGGKVCLSLFIWNPIPYLNAVRVPKKDPSEYCISHPDRQQRQTICVHVCKWLRQATFQIVV